jgi:pantoate--beta-alanine ligase
VSKQPPRSAPGRLAFDDPPDEELGPTRPVRIPRDRLGARLPVDEAPAESGSQPRPAAGSAVTRQVSTRPDRSPLPEPADADGDAGPRSGSPPRGARPRVVSTRAELAAALAALRAGGRTLALVPTMGALHAGHAALVRAAAALADAVAVTVFVNPLQFGPGEDLDRYPRTPEADLALLGELGVQLVFAPTAEEVYPSGPPAVTVDPGPLGDLLEGASRPGHFAGVLTVVTKLLGLLRPDVAVFGEKDYQQLALIRHAVTDLELAVDIVGVPTVREPDGMALSSRNSYLSPADRVRATALSRALRAGAAAGPDGAEAVLAAATVVLPDAGIEVDYLALRGPDLGPAPERGPARLLVAARIGGTRLIDNVPLVLGGPQRTSVSAEARSESDGDRADGLPAGPPPEQPQ